MFESKKSVRVWRSRCLIISDRRTNTALPCSGRIYKHIFFRSDIQSNNWIKQCLLTDHVHSRIYKHICFQVKYSIKLLNQSLLTDHKHSNRMHQVNNLSQLCRKVLARGLSCQVNLCLVFICSWCAFDPVQTYNTKSSDVWGAVFAVAYTESKLCGIGEHNKHKNRQWQKMTIEEW